MTFVEMAARPRLWAAGRRGHHAETDANSSKTQGEFLKTHFLFQSHRARILEPHLLDMI